MRLSNLGPSRLALSVSRHCAGLLLSLAVVACGGSEADPDGPPPSRPPEATRNTALPPIPEGSIPRELEYSARRYRKDGTFAEGMSMMSIDQRQSPGQPPWRLTNGPPSYWRGTEAHLTGDLRVAWLQDAWRHSVRLSREGDELVGNKEYLSTLDDVLGRSDTLRIPLPPGVPFYTDLSLQLLLAAWPVAPGWEERGMMAEGRHSFRVVPVRIRVVGEETVSTPLGTVECWIVVVHGPRNSRRSPHWYWVSKRDRVVVMRRHYIPTWLGGVLEEHLLRKYPTESRVLIDVVVVGPPRSDAAPIVAFELAVGPGNYLARNSWDDDTLYRFAVSAHPERNLTSSDSTTIARLLDSAGYSGRYRIEPPTDRSFVKVPRTSSMY